MTYKWEKGELVLVARVFPVMRHCRRVEMLLASLFGPDNRRGSLQNTKPPPGDSTDGMCFRHACSVKPSCHGLFTIRPMQLDHQQDPLESESTWRRASWSMVRKMFCSLSAWRKGATNHELTSIASLVYLFGPLSGERDCYSIGMPSKRLYRLLRPLEFCLRRLLSGSGRRLSLLSTKTARRT